MGLLPAALLTELQKPSPKIQLWLDLGPLPDGTTWRLSTHSESPGVSGPGEARVLRWGTLRRAIDPFTGDPTPVELNIDITDEGDTAAERRRFAKLAAKYPRTLRRTPANLVLSGGGATYTLFTSIQVTYHQTGPMRWNLKLRTDDSAIDTDSGASVPKVPLAAFFPSIHDDVRSYYSPIVYGEHDSNGSGNKGFVPCYQVDTVGMRYVVGTSGAKSVVAVYDDDGIIATSEYAVTRPTEKGALFTIIDFSVAPNGEVRADVEGLTASIDGSGSILANGTALKHFLVNYVWGDHRGGAYLADASAPVYAASFTDLDTFLARAGHESSLWVGGAEQRKAAEVLREWLDSHGVLAYWRNDGKLAVGVLDPIPPADIYSSSFPHYEANEDEQGAFELTHDETNIAREVSGQYVRNASTGEFLQTFRAQDVTVPEKVNVSRQLHNAAARVV